MHDAHARAIVDTALALSKTHPHAPAPDILDLVMQGPHRTDPDFTANGRPFATWTDPQSPFGQLLRRAYASQRDEAEVVDMLRLDFPDPEDLREVLREWWAAEVVSPFAERYELWDMKRDVEPT